MNIYCQACGTGNKYLGYIREFFNFWGFDFCSISCARAYRANPSTTNTSDGNFPSQRRQQ